MRERVAVVGGRLDVGPVPRGRLPGRASARSRSAPPSTPAGVRVTVRVVLVDDQAMVRTGLRMVLAAEPDIDVVGEAADGASGLRVVTELKPDVVLLDVRMPGMDGLEAARRILAADLPTRVIVLTTFDEDEYVAAALRAGVSGFLLKVAPPEDLVVAVRTVAAGQGLLDPAVTLRVIESFAAAPAPDPVRAGRLAQLTEREVDVLGLVAAGLTNGEIAARALPGRGDGQDPRQPGAAQARPARPRPGGGVRLRERAGDAGPVTWGHRRSSARRSVVVLEPAPTPGDP